MIIFIRYFLLLAYVIANNYFSIIIIDVEPCGSQTFHNEYLLPTPVSNSLRIITFDTDAQKIQQIDFLAFNHRSIEWSHFKLTTCTIEFLPSDMKNFRIIPAGEFRGIIRKCGVFDSNLSVVDLFYLDKTRPTLKGIICVDFPPAGSFADFQTDLNRHDILEQCKQQKINEIEDEIRKLDNKDPPHQYTLSHSKASTDKYKKAQTQLQKNVQKRNRLREEKEKICSGAQRINRTNLTSGGLNVLLHRNDRGQQYQQRVSFDNNSSLDEFCELACDLTMMCQAFTKLEGKYAGIKGFDGLYMRDNIIIAAESKFWATPPTLHTVISEKIIPKFDFLHSGAIKHIIEQSREEIQKAYRINQIYMLPYTMLSSGRIDCRLEHFTGEITFPRSSVEGESSKLLIEQGKASLESNSEISSNIAFSSATEVIGEATPVKNPTRADLSDYTSPETTSAFPSLIDTEAKLTPESHEKDRKEYLRTFIDKYIADTGSTIGEAQLLLISILEERSLEQDKAKRNLLTELS